MIQPRVGVALTLVQIFFGVHYFAAKIILQSVPPRAWAAMRIGSAAVLLLAYELLFRRRGPRGAANWARLAIYALFGVVLNQTLFVEGLARTTPSHSSMINSLMPVLTLGIAILAGRERATLGRIGALAVSFASVLVLLQVENFRLHDELVKGDLLTLANAVSFSIFLVASRDFFRVHDPLSATAYLLGFGAIGILIIGAKPLAAVDFGALPPKVWWAAAYAVVCATVLAYILNSYALRHTDSSMVALFIYLQPPLATALSMRFLGERPTLRFWIASIGILTGVFLAVREQRSSAGALVGAPPRRVGRGTEARG